MAIHGPTLHSPTSDDPRADVHQSASRLPASDRSPTDPALRANPFPEVTDPFCRLPLPTLFYQLEAVHLGDLMRLSVRPGAKITRSLGFSRAVESAPDATTSVALCRTFNPISSQSDSRVLCPLRRKENSSQGSRRRLRVRLRRRLGHGALSASRFGNVNPIPFRGTALARPTGGRPRLPEGALPSLRID